MYSTRQTARTNYRTSTFLLYLNYWCCKCILSVVLGIFVGATQGIESSPGTILHNPRLNTHRRFICAPVQKFIFYFSSLSVIFFAREEEVAPSYSLTAAERLTANWFVSCSFRAFAANFVFAFYEPVQFRLIYPYVIFKTGDRKNAG